MVTGRKTIPKPVEKPNRAMQFPRSAPTFLTACTIAKNRYDLTTFENECPNAHNRDNSETTPRQRKQIGMVWLLAARLVGHKHTKPEFPHEQSNQ